MQHLFSRFRNLHWKFTFSFTFIAAGLYLLSTFILPYLMILVLFFQSPNTGLVVALERTIAPKLVQPVAQTPPDIAQINEVLDPLCRGVKHYPLSHSVDYLPGPCAAAGYKKLEIVRETTADGMEIIDGTQNLDFVAVLDQDGNVLTSSPPGLIQRDILANLNHEEQKQFAAMIAGDSWWTESVWRRLRTRSTLTIAGIHALDEDASNATPPNNSSAGNHTHHGYIVVQAGLPPFAVYAGPQTLLGVTIVILPFIFLIALLTSALVTRRIVKRLQMIEDAASAWAQGDFTVVIEDQRQDEIGRLAQHLNHMATMQQSREKRAL